MDKRIKAALAVVALAAAFGAQAEETGAFYVAGNLGSSYAYDRGLSDRTDVAGGVRGGYEWRSDPWPDGHIDFGVELGYVDLGKASGNDHVYVFNSNNNYIGTFPGRFSLHPSGPTLGGTIRWKFADRWFMYGRAGYMHAKQKLSLYVPELNLSDTHEIHSNAGYTSIGIGYDFTERFSVGFGYDYYFGSGSYHGLDYNSHIGVASGTAQFRF